MDLPLTSNPGALTDLPVASSLAFLLQRGLDCTQRGSYVEGAAFFTLAREQLTPDQVHVAVLLDAFLQSHASYWQAQQSLHTASKRFVEADIERQAHLLGLNKLLLALNEETNTEVQPHAALQPHEFSEAHQPQQLRQPTRPIPVGSNHSNDSGRRTSPPQQLSLKDGVALPGLYVTCFGRFEVKRLDEPIVLCQRRNGQVIFRYLVAQVGYRASADKLMDVLWAQDTPEVARRKLQIAISALRCSLNHGYRCGPGEGYILCKDGFYQFNPSVAIRTDVDEFLLLWQAGRQSSGSELAALYERACNLCSGPFLVEDMYADWTSTRREQLKQIYFTMCRALAGYYLEARHYADAVKWTSAILSEDRCDEAAHRQLIQIYLAQGRRSEALQQYYRCERALSKELSTPPMPETMAVLQTVLNSTDLPSREKSSGE
jgi:DNA-binding SARP family transcriptional activator